MRIYGKRTIEIERKWSKWKEMYRFHLCTKCYINIKNENLFFHGYIEVSNTFDQCEAYKPPNPQRSAHKINQKSQTHQNMEDPTQLSNPMKTRNPEGCNFMALCLYFFLSFCPINFLHFAFYFFSSFFSSISSISPTLTYILKSCIVKLMLTNWNQFYWIEQMNSHSKYFLLDININMQNFGVAILY